MNAIGGFSAPLNGVRPSYPAKMSSHQKQETPRTGLSGTHYMNMTDVENLAACKGAARCMPKSIRQDARCGRIDLGGHRLI